ncbi:MAG: GNAT family N-acetyltransferase [Candidatus Diapherotrites archaeon]|nr:GNAT family N-acetyltransferase [Candidatus Diapherotrites archaeon]
MPWIRGKERRKRYERSKWRIVRVDPNNEKHVNMLIELSKIGAERGELLMEYAHEDVKDMTNRGIVFLAFHGDKPIGYQITTFPKKRFVLRDNEGNKIDLSGHLYEHFLFIHPDYRGKGWGKRLRNKVLDYLAKHTKAKGIFYEVGTLDGLRFLESLVKEGELEKHVVDERTLGQRIRDFIKGEDMPEVEVKVETDEKPTTYTYFIPLGIVYTKPFKRRSK